MLMWVSFGFTFNGPARSAGTVSDWASVTVNAFAVEYDSRTAGFGSVLVEYLAIGDEMTLPSEGFSSKGYTFTGWYNTPKGAAGNGKMFAEGATFQGNAYTVVYAEWTPVTYNLTLKTDAANAVKGNAEMLDYIRYNVRSSFDKAFEDAIARHYKQAGDSQENENKWHNIILANNFVLEDGLMYQKYMSLVWQKGQNLDSLEASYGNLLD